MTIQSRALLATFRRRTTRSHSPGYTHFFLVCSPNRTAATERITRDGVQA